MGKIGFWEALSIGIGGMVGGGIFAVLGLTILLARGAAPLAFLIAGIVALLTAYSYAKLSVRYPSEGGTIEYLVRAFGGGITSGWLNVLLLASYVIMLSLYSYTFGSYLSSIFPGGESYLARSTLALVVIAAFTGLNMLGARAVGRSEDALVAFKVSVLLLFSALGALVASVARLSPNRWTPPLEIMAGGLVIFLAYEGFELIANTAHDVREPERTLPKAFYASVSFVMALYVVVAIVAVGNLTLNQVIQARDYALAVAAMPFMGEAGFILIGIAAAVSTASAINATLYGSARVSYIVARYGELPRSMGRIWHGAYEGLLVIAVLTAASVLSLDLEEISVAGSLGFLMVFASVNAAAYRLHRRLGSSKFMHVAGLVACIASAVVLAVRSYETSPVQLLIAFALIIGSGFVEVIYRTITGRSISEYVDWRLKEKLELVRSWGSWVDDFAKVVKEELEALEVHLVGSVARGETHRAHDVDLLVISERPLSSSEAASKADELASRMGLPKHHPVHLHFSRPEEKGIWLRKSVKSKRIA